MLHIFLLDFLKRRFRVWHNVKCVDILGGKSDFKNSTDIVSVHAAKTGGRKEQLVCGDESISLFSMHQVFHWLQSNITYTSKTWIANTLLFTLAGFDGSLEKSSLFAQQKGSFAHGAEPDGQDEMLTWIFCMAAVGGELTSVCVCVCCKMQQVLKERHEWLVSTTDWDC